MVERISERFADMVKVFAPAKINLFLAVMGKRDDGYHELCSVLGKLSIADSLEIRRKNGERGIKIKCPKYKDLETENNLACIAVKKWLLKRGEDWAVDLILHKQLPPMSGLGGGSSDAVSALLAMNELGDEKLSRKEIIKMAAEIGSDCPSFLENGLCMAEGRGEMVRTINHSAAHNLIGQKVLLFRPNIGLSTPDVFQRLSQTNKFSSVEWVHTRLGMWEKQKISITEFLHNDLESAVFYKHRYFSAIFEKIKKTFGLAPRMSGSGSCCFVLIPDEFERVAALESLIYQAWGDDSWLKFTEIIH